MIIDAASARERVRLILDRANSPWLTDTEINGFIEMAINEYLRERVGLFGANQKIRDDFGKYVKSIVYSNVLTDNLEAPGADIIRRQFLQFNANGQAIPNILLPIIIPGGEFANDGNGVACSIKDFEDDDDSNNDNLHFGYLIDIKVYGTQVTGGGVAAKVLELDDVMRVKADPFRNAASGEYEDLISAGIIDAAKVTRSALQNAASIAALFLTTEAVIADAPEENAAGAGMPDMDF